MDKSASIQFTLELVGDGFDPIKEKIELRITRGELKVVFKGSETPIPKFKDIRNFPTHFTPARVFLNRGVCFCFSHSSI